ncbi:MAG TPA: TrmH family RNA methyltransferase [Candidatus Saccharimonadales bacterium]|nr:TrmH family RNA methyltransferase [Candidatus Saccharimonadales bacterium]
MKTVVVAHNIRSTLNVGSFFRTCDGFGVDRLYLTGYTPYPRVDNDDRLRHIVEGLTDRIHKTALGAENSVPFSHYEDVLELISKLKTEGYTVVGLEQSNRAMDIRSFHPASNEMVALVLGEEVNGIPKVVLDHCPTLIEIPMKGAKESFNVSVALGIALYQLSLSI